MADQFENQYGDLVRNEYSELKTAYRLDQALRKRKPAIKMTQGVLQQWFLKYGVVSDPGTASAITVSSRLELETKYGHVLEGLADQYPTPFKRCGAFKKQSPSVLVTPGCSKEWFKYHRGQLKFIGSAGDLEKHCGSCIREHGVEGISADDLQVWLRTNASV